MNKKKTTTIIEAFTDEEDSEGEEEEINEKSENGIVENINSEINPKIIQKLKHEKIIDLKKEKYLTPLKDDDIKAIPTQVIRTRLRHQRAISVSGAEDAARSEILLTEKSGLLSSRISQKELVNTVDVSSAKKRFDLELNKGPYNFRWSTNAKFVLLGGRKGHLGLFNWFNNSLLCELNVDDAINDVSFLHNENLVAVAQKDHTYIYDKSGREINRLRSFYNPLYLDYLLYHLLLVTASKKQLGWLDITLGTFAARHKVKNVITAMRHNPTNAVTHLAHTNGTVSLWAPNSSEYLVKINCHPGPIHHLAVDTKGNLLATASTDCIKFWDLRSAYQPLSSLKAHRISGLDFSQRGLFAFSSKGNLVQVYDSYLNPPFKSQLYHNFPPKANIQSIRFCPFEDVLGVAKLDGFSTMLVPGAGEANFDSAEANPFQTKNQRREATVKRVLDKIPADLIALDPTVVGTVVDNPEEYLEDAKAEQFDKDHPGKITPKFKKKGRSSATKVAAKKEHARMERKRALHEEERKKVEGEQKEKKQKTSMDALGRFEK